VSLKSASSWTSIRFGWKIWKTWTRRPVCQKKKKKKVGARYLKQSFSASEDSVEIYTPERPFIVYFGSLSNKKLWINSVRKGIADSLGVPEAEISVRRDSQYQYKDGSYYIGDWFDAMRHGTGKVFFFFGSLCLAELKMVFFPSVTARAVKQDLLRRPVCERRAARPRHDVLPHGRSL